MWLVSRRWGSPGLWEIRRRKKSREPASRQKVSLPLTCIWYRQWVPAFYPVLTQHTACSPSRLLPQSCPHPMAPPTLPELRLLGDASLMLTGFHLLSSCRSSYPPQVTPLGWCASLMLTGFCLLSSCRLLGLQRVVWRLHQEQVVHPGFISNSPAHWEPEAQHEVWCINHL